MKVYDIIKQRRSIRSYLNKKVPDSILMECLDSARLAPTGRNSQPLEFILVTKNLEEIFSCTAWAGSISWKPTIADMPHAYIFILSNKKIATWNLSMDVGIAAENIVICAESEGISSCMLGALKKPELKKILAVPDNYEIELAVALGYAKHKSSVEDMKDNDNKYSIDTDGNFHIPKRKLSEVAHMEKFR